MIHYGQYPASLFKLSKKVYEADMRDQQMALEATQGESSLCSITDSHKLTERLLQEDIIALVSEFSLEFENVYTLYLQPNYEAQEILHNWDEIKADDARVGVEGIYVFLTDAEIIPIYITIDDFTSLCTKTISSANIDCEDLKHLLLFRKADHGDDEEIQMPELGFYEMMNFILRIGVKLLADDNIELFDLPDLLRVFLRSYLYMRSDMEILGQLNVYTSLTPFLKYLQAHSHNIRDKVIVPEAQEEEIRHFVTESITSVETFTENLVDKKLIKQTLGSKLLKVDFPDVDEKKYMDDNKKDRVLGEQIPQPRVRKQLPKKPIKAFNNRRDAVKIDPFFKRKPIEDITHDYKHSYNLYIKMRNDENNKDLNTKEMYKLSRLPEIIYEIVDIPEVSERDYIDVIKILYLVNTNQLLSCLKLITYISHKVEKDKFISREYLAYLYFTKGVVYLKAEKYDEAMTLFYHCMALSPV